MNIVKLSTSVVVLAAIMQPVSANDESIESCTRLLPEGKKYEITINGIADRNKDKLSFEGSFSVDGGAEDVDSFDIGPFVECVGPLIKTLDIEAS